MEYIATYWMSNTHAMCIIEIEHWIEDLVISVLMNWDKKNWNITKSIIHYDDRSYFKKYWTKFYMDEFLRTDIF